MRSLGRGGMMGVRFAIEGWSACASGLHAPSDWRAWACAPWLPEGPLEAKLAGMPPMQRRRLNPLGRAAAQVAWDCHTPGRGVPVVFASGYGDAQRCLHLLKDGAAGEPMSPTDFALSVHNAIGAMYSITRADGAAYTSVAAGPASCANGLIEAAGLLADGAPEVLLVCYDAPPPDEYAGFAREASCAYAWAWRVTAPQPGQPHLELTWTADDGGNEAGSLPFGLDSLRFALSDAATSTRACEGRRWTWSRHA